jgi:peptidoglycan/LPS O-acetylase OafA/YrhL
MIVATIPQVKKRFYRSELDVLRFFAFLMVYLTHSLPHDVADWQRYHLPPFAADLMGAIAGSGRFGVTLFFLLSAFLITSLLLQERSTTGNVNLRSFYVRRSLRIWPLYFFAVGLAVLWPWSGRLPLAYLAGFLLLAGNWIQIVLGSPHSWAQILWSVSIEEQFYLSWPIAAKVFSRRILTVIAIGLILFANLTRLYLVTHQASEQAIWPNTFVQLDAFGMGILCALSMGAVPSPTFAKLIP